MSNTTQSALAAILITPSQQEVKSGEFTPITEVSKVDTASCSNTCISGTCKA